MSQNPGTHTAHPDPRSPLVFDTRTLGRQPGSARSETRIVPAPADWRVALAGVPAGTEVKLNVMLEAVTDGVLVTAEATAPVTGECARCLEPVASTVDVTFRELYEPDRGPQALASEPDDDVDRRFMHGDLIDLEPAFRDAVVLTLPLAPLCRSDCEGLCPECGTPLAEAGPGHSHGEAADPRWAALNQLDLGEQRPNGAGAVEGQEA
jgi:uncharacterized protein